MSKFSGNWFDKIFNKGAKSEPKPNPSVKPLFPPKKSRQYKTQYKIGDLIHQKYRVGNILGKGGFGIVYLVYSQEMKGYYALKTIRDEILIDQNFRKRFHKEASVWIDLGRHPYIVHAYVVDEMEKQLYIVMEYIDPPNKKGLNSLNKYLHEEPPDLMQSLRWAIQICYGMEYAYSKGIRAHRDLKPSNIMISREKKAKITDFGLVGVVGAIPESNSRIMNTHADKKRLTMQTEIGAGFGTPTHMAPEQFINAANCDERSDIYSFGIVLYQMASGGQIPFPLLTHVIDSNHKLPNLWQAMQKLHNEAPILKINSPLFPIIQQCLEKLPLNRYPTFRDLRKDFESLLSRYSGEVIPTPRLKKLTAWEWSNKGVSLGNLNRHEEAIRCFNKALELKLNHENVWVNKAASLIKLGNYQEAIQCCDKALELDPKNVLAWSNKGNSFNYLIKYKEAIQCCEKALELDPNYIGAWINKSVSLRSLKRHEEAIQCDDKALELDPRSVMAWTSKGTSYLNLACYEKAINCFDKAIKFNPHHIDAWYNKAVAERKLGHSKEAAYSYRKFLSLAPLHYAKQIAYAQKHLKNLEAFNL